MEITPNDRVLGPGSNLRDRLSFPTFGDCPHEFDLDRRYLQESESNPQMAMHKRHWCFLGEIVSVLAHDKLELLVRDTAGRTVRLECLSEDRGRSIASQPNCKPKNTIAVLYALQHPFEDQRGALALGPDDNTDIAVSLNSPIFLRPMLMGLSNRFFRIRYNNFSQLTIGFGDNITGLAPPWAAITPRTYWLALDVG